MASKYDLKRPHDMMPSGTEDVNTSHPEEAEGSGTATSGSEALKAGLAFNAPPIAYGPQDPPSLVSSTKPHPKRKVDKDDPAWKKKEKQTRLDPTKGVGGPSYIGDIDKAELAVLKELIKALEGLVNMICKDSIDSEYSPPDRINDLPDGKERQDYSQRARTRPVSDSMTDAQLGQGTAGNNTTAPKYYKR